MDLAEKSREVLATQGNVNGLKYREKESFRPERRKQETVMQLTHPTPLHYASALLI
jgi:hypothetical protein